MRKFLTICLTFLLTASLQVPASASATAEVTFSQTKFNIAEDNIFSLVWSASDFAIDRADFYCGNNGKYVSFGTSPHLTTRSPYVFFDGQSVTPGSYSPNHRYQWARKVNYPWVSGSVQSVVTRVKYTLRIAVPKNTVKTTGDCQVTGVVTTLDGKTTQIDPGITLSFFENLRNDAFTGGAVTGSLSLNRSSSPYYLKSPIILGEQSKIIIGPGVKLFVEHDGAVFEGGGVGGISLLGTADQPIRVADAKTLWKSGPHELEIRHSVFTNFGSIINAADSGGRPFGVKIYDSQFIGTRNGGVGGWRVPIQLILENNYFKNIPAFDFGLWGSGNSKKVVRGNWFEGSSSDMGYWISGESVADFSNNVFANFSSPVVLKVFPKKPRNNASIPLNWLTLKSSYFNGYSIAQESFIAAKDQVNGPDFSSNGFRLENVLSAPPFADPTLTSSKTQEPKNDSTPSLVASQKTLASYSETVTALTAQQRAQVKTAVEANPNATKFICTGIRYVSQPMSENIKVRKRAKAACDYAKTLNPELSTWYQNKPTEARSYAGKVLLTIKSPAN